MKSSYADCLPRILKANLSEVNMYNEIPINDLRDLLQYNEETGRLFWLVKKGQIYPGKEAFKAKNSAGYHHGAIAGKFFLAHRVAWALYFGEWPKGWIDHRNTIITDNSIKNLRLATPSENNCNKSSNRLNTSGYKGVSYSKNSKSWQAVIYKDSVQTHLGFFSTREDARDAYKKANILLHGDFSRPEYLK